MPRESWTLSPSSQPVTQPTTLSFPGSVQHHRELTAQPLPPSSALNAHTAPTLAHLQGQLTDCTLALEGCLGSCAAIRGPGSQFSRGCLEDGVQALNRLMGPMSGGQLWAEKSPEEPSQEQGPGLIISEEQIDGRSG